MSDGLNLTDGLTQSLIASTLGISGAAVSKAVKSGMPTSDWESIIRWRDSRPRHKVGVKEMRLRRQIENGGPGPIPKKEEPPAAPTPKKKRKEKRIAPPKAPKPSDLPQPEIAPFVLEPTEALESPDDDFDSEMIAQSETVMRMAFQKYKDAAKNRDPIMMGIALKTWGEAGKVAAKIRSDFIATREKARQLVDLDEVLSGIGIEVAEWKRIFQTLPAYLAGQIPPEHLAKVAAAVERVEFDMMPRAETVAKRLFAEPLNEEKSENQQGGE